MQAVMKIIEEPESEIREQSIPISRLPVLGEYVRAGNDWFQVKRVVHLAGDRDVAGEIYVVSIVDPTRERLRLYEWLEPAP